MQPDDVSAILFRRGERQRFTQDTPILPDAWMAFAADPAARRDLLITPLETISANSLLRDLLEDLDPAAAIDAEPVALRGFVAAKLTFKEIVNLVLPRTQWAHELNAIGREAARKAARDADATLELIDRIEAERVPDRAAPEAIDDVRQRISLLAFAKKASIWRVALNRPLTTSDEQARSTVKADAAFRVFDTRCADITWAVVDSGIDTTHPAFSDAKADASAQERRRACRVKGVYDFTRLRALLNAGYRDHPGDNPKLAEACALAGLSPETGEELLRDAHRALKTDTMDWSAIEKLIRLQKDDDTDPPVPADGHGTHVAGILGANWREVDGTPIVVGLCPDIKLVDLRILGPDEASTEFAIIAALQFIRFLNGRNQYIAVHGVNLSLSIEHNVDNYACGRTPVCDECERLVGAGVSVVAAAGNQGYRRPGAAAGGPFGAYSTVSITDPGNAESVITVGSTHKREPHTYGISYFSSRGPTGDGRSKPDLVAPGERIRSTLPNGEYGPLDGTSQAAPHVSGAAALLMARYPELIGQPRKIKEVLCASAMDLGRERIFQGHGLLDILRALQSF